MGFMITRQHYRNRKTGQVSTNYIEILPKVLTLNREFKPSRKSTGNSMTPFKEIELVPAEEIVNSEMRSVFAEKISIIEETRAQLCEKLISRLKEIVSENWDSKAINIVMHSSGLDSRMLSWLIKTLHNEYGNDWLGRVIFICSNPEAESFKSIIDYVGWNADQSFVPEDEEEGATYSLILSDFRNAWRKCNGRWMYPINMFYYFPTLALKYYGLLGHRVHLWTGLFGNEIAPHVSGNDGNRWLTHQYKWLYHLSAFSARPAFGNRYIKPYTDLEYLRLILISTVHLTPQRFREVLLRTMDPELLRFPNLNAAGHRTYHLPEEALDFAVRQYERSWYGREIYRKLIFPKWNDTSTIWDLYFSSLNHWGLASLVEHLRKNGYKIR